MTDLGSPHSSTPPTAPRTGGALIFLNPRQVDNTINADPRRRFIARDDNPTRAANGAGSRRGN